MSTGELGEKYFELFGVPTRSRNKEYLRKHIAWRLQERAEGGLSARALDRIQEIAPQAPARWQRPSAKRAGGRTDVPALARSVRDPRLPVAGQILTRVHRGVEHRVTVREHGFDYNGESHRTLSGIARLITGQAWNGFVFFFGRGGGAKTGAQAGGE